MNMLNPGNNNLDEIVFANRNKSYGAYALRKAYPDHLVKSVLIAFGGITLLYVYPQQTPPGKLSDSLKGDSMQIVVLDNRLSNFEIEADLSKPETGLRERVTKPDNQSYRIIPDKEAKDTKPAQPATPDPKAGTSTGSETGTGGSGGGTATGGSTSIALPVIETPEPIRTFVEKMPEFPGGTGALFTFLKQHIRYPELAARIGKEGKVVVSFVINADGKISQIEIERSIGFGCDEEAARVIELMPDWIPGGQNGKAVPVRFKLPISFVLSN